MPKFHVSRSLAWEGTITPRVVSLCRMFGLTTDRLTTRTLTHACDVEVRPGDIVFIGGPSGAGKTVLLKELQAAVPADDRTSLEQIALPNDRTLIDCVDGDLVSAIRLFSTAGLNDVFCLLNQPARLSEGQQYRFRLAMALHAGKPFVFADEFVASLDRLTAAVISHKVRQFATRTGTTFFLAASQDDFLLDLEPDVLVTTQLAGETVVIYKDARKGTRRCPSVA